LRSYPGSDHVEEAAAELQRMQDVLVEHELYAAQWNLRHENPLGAARRAMYVADSYPDATRMPDALFLYSRAMLELGDVDQASAALRRLRDEYGGTEAGEAARDWLLEYGL
jgi:outer membrane protein assembly factor BamD (BamD/ComL family)